MQVFSGNEEVTPTPCNLVLGQYHTTCWLEAGYPLAYLSMEMLERPESDG